jgi:hypothetical protein
MTQKKSVCECSGKPSSVVRGKNSFPLVDERTQPVCSASSRTWMVDVEDLLAVSRPENRPTNKNKYEWFDAQ